MIANLEPTRETTNLTLDLKKSIMKSNNLLLVAKDQEGILPGKSEGNKEKGKCDC